MIKEVKNMKKKKGEMNMTETITNIQDFFDTCETELKCSTPRMDDITDFLKIKRIANANKDIIELYTEKNKNIKNGKIVLKGTRITLNELVLIITEAKKQGAKTIDEILKYTNMQYPSIDSKEQIVAGLLCFIKEQNTLKYVIRVICKK